MGCVEGDAFSGSEITLSRMTRIEDIFERNPAVRAVLMNMEPDNRSARTLYDWIEEHTGLNPLKPADWAVLDKQPEHLARMLRMIMSADKQYKDGMAALGKEKNPAKLMAEMQRNLYLPQTLVEKWVIGGGMGDRDIFLEWNVNHQRAEGMRSRMNIRISSVLDSLSEIYSFSFSRVEKELAKLEELQASPSATEAQKAQAIKERERILSGSIEGVSESERSTARGSRAIRDIVMALNGYVVSADGSVATPIMKKQSYEEAPSGRPEELKMITVIDEGKLLRHFMASWRANGLITKNTTEETATKKLLPLIREIVGIISDTTVLARQGVEAQKQSMFDVLTGPNLSWPAEKATKWVNENIKFKEEENYFPHIAIRKLNAYDVAIKELVKADTDGSLAENLAEALKGVDAQVAQMIPTSADFLKERLSDRFSINRYSMQLGTALSSHAEDVISHWETNQTARSINKYIGKIWEARKAVEPGDRDSYVGYVQGVSRFLTDLAYASKGQPRNEVLNDLARTAVAVKSTMLLGVPNMASPVQNWVEGAIRITMAQGIHKNRTPWIEEIIKRENPRMMISVNEMLMDGNRNRRIEKLSNAYGKSGSASRWIDVERETEEMGKMGMVVHANAEAWSKIAGKSLVGMQWVENNLRRRAWSFGAEAEHAKLVSLFRDKFDIDGEGISDGVLAAHGVTKADIKENREKAWQRFVEQRVVKAGYDNVYRTQWNYNQINRARWEQGLWRPLTMFQHFPASWLATLQSSMRTAGLDFQVGMEGHSGLTAVASGVGEAMNPRVKLEKGGLLGFKVRRSGAPSDLDHGTAHRMIMATGFMVSYAISQLFGQRFNVFNLGAVDAVGDFVAKPIGHKVLEALGAVAKDNMYGDFEETEGTKKMNALYGKGIANFFTGPYYTEVMDTISLLFYYGGVSDGSLPWAIRANIGNKFKDSIGLRPNPDDLNNYGSRDLLPTNYIGEPMYPLLSLEMLQRLSNEAFGLGGWNGGKKVLKFWSLSHPESYNAAMNTGVGSAIEGQMDPNQKLRGRKANVPKAVAEGIGFYQTPWDRWIPGQGEEGPPPEQRAKI